jgi:hypothetical protein
MVKTITVETGDKLREGEVAIWQKDDAHPEGEVYVTNRPGGAYRVGLTPAVQRALGEGRLEQVDDDTSEPTKVRVKRQSPPRGAESTPPDTTDGRTTDGGGQAPA